MRQIADQIDLAIPAKIVFGDCALCENTNELLGIGGLLPTNRRHRRFDTATSLSYLYSIGCVVATLRV
jgi:hypothetical protein